MTDTEEEELDLRSLSDKELVEQMHDDLFDGLKEEIEEGTNILLERGWAPDKLLADALVEGMRSHDKVPMMGSGEIRPRIVITVMTERKQGILPVGASDRNGESLVPDTMLNSIRQKVARRFSRPIQPLPVHWMKPLVAAQHHRIYP